MQNSNEKSKSTDNFKLGQFKTSYVVNDEKVELLIDPLSQNDMAEDWRLVLPSINRTSTRHHFNVYLSQLPQHLWYKLFQENNEYYRTIKDNIYSYSVKVSESDDKLLLLFDLLNTVDCRVHLEKIRNLYSELYKENVRGWIMIKTKRLLF
jgi:hypothetical protein